MKGAPSRKRDRVSEDENKDTMEDGVARALVALKLFFDSSVGVDAQYDPLLKTLTVTFKRFPRGDVGYDAGDVWEVAKRPFDKNSPFMRHMRCVAGLLGHELKDIKTDVHMLCAMIDRMKPHDENERRMMTLILK